MKKTLRTWLSLMGVALLATSMKVYAEGETLTEVWKQTDIPGHADARHATAFGGKIYVQDKGAKKIFVYDGTQKTEIASAGGTSITVDDAGNLVYAKKFPVSTAASQAICPAGGTSSQDLTLTLNPDGRIDFMGRMTGDIMSAEGGTMYFLPPTATKVQCVEIKNGVQTGTTETGTITSANNGQTYAIASSYDGKIVYQVRTDKAIYQFDEAKTTATAFKTPNINSSAGFAIFKLYGVTYVVYPTGTNYKDGFSIANQETGEVVAVHEEEASSVASSNATANWLYADVENDNTASIYQFSPGNFVAKYTFTVPAIVEPAIADRNIFAYGLTATEEGENYTLAYNLNTDATNVTINIKNADGTVVKTIEGTTAAGANSVSVAKADIQGDNLSWEVVAKGTAITEMARITPQTMDYAAWAPYGVDVDNNPESKHFGQVYVTNSGEGDCTKPDGKITVKKGLFVYDQNLQRRTINEKTVFDGGTTFESVQTYYDPRTVKVAADGTLFLGCNTTTHAPLFTIDPDQPDTWTPVFEGTQDADGVITDASGNFVAGGTMAMSLIGGVKDQKLYILGTKKLGAAYLSLYNIGDKKTWDEAPSAKLAVPQGFVNPQANQILADPMGGYWVSQHRGAGNTTEPTLMHYNAAGTRDYQRYSADAERPNLSYGAGMAMTLDGKTLAISSSKGSSSPTVTLYDVVYAENGTPTLTEGATYNLGIGSNLNALAFDYAGNLHAVSNSGEWYAAYALPKAENETTVPCSKDNMLNKKELKADRNIFAYDLTATDEGNNYKLEYKLNTDAADVTINIKNADGKVIKSYNGGTAASGNVVNVAKHDIQGENVSWEVEATGTAITEMARITPQTMDYAAWAPYGVDVDNNPESKHFGQVYVTNSAEGDCTKSDGKITVKRGLFIYDQNLQRRTINEKTVFDGGITFDPQANATYFDPRTVKVAADGTLFLGCNTTTHAPLYTIDPDQPDTWSPVFEGTQDEHGIIKDASGNFIAGGTMAMSFTGTGKDQKLYVVGTKDRASSFSINDMFLSLYNIGDKKTWNETPSKTLTVPEGLTNTQANQILADPMGGYWVSQHRAAGNSTEPTLMHYNAAGIRDYARYSADTERPNFCYGGGMAMTLDGKTLAVSSSKGSSSPTVTLYDVVYDENGTPTLTEGATYDLGIGGNLNALAFDYAGNLHAVSNSGEWYAAYALPKAENKTAVPCSKDNLLNYVEVKVYDPIENLAAEPNYTDKTMVLTWDAPSGTETPIRYVEEYATVIEGVAQTPETATVEAGTTEWAQTNMTDGIYQYSVTAYYQNGEQEVASEKVTITKEYKAPSNVEDAVETVEKVYPNPTTGILNISSSQAIEDIEVYSTAGMLVTKVNGNGDNVQQININDVAPGTYFVKVNGGKAMKVIKK